VVDRCAEAAAVNAIASGSQHSTISALSHRIPRPSSPPRPNSSARVTQRHRFALGDRRAGLDATALHLEVGKRFCGLLALDDEGSAIPRMKSGTPATGSPRHDLADQRLRPLSVHWSKIFLQNFSLIGRLSPAFRRIDADFTADAFCACQRGVPMLRNCKGSVEGPRRATLNLKKYLAIALIKHNDPRLRRFPEPLHTVTHHAQDHRPCRSHFNGDHPCFR
jgi:hypothetical protein